MNDKVFNILVKIHKRNDENVEDLREAYWDSDRNININVCAAIIRYYNEINSYIDAVLKVNNKNA